MTDMYPIEHLWLTLSELTKTGDRHPFPLKGRYSWLAADWCCSGTPHKAYLNGLAAASTCQPEICTSVLCDSNSWSYYTPQQGSCPITATQSCLTVITPPAHTHPWRAIMCKWNSHFQGERKELLRWWYQMGRGYCIRMGAAWLWGVQWFNANPPRWGKTLKFCSKHHHLPPCMTTPPLPESVPCLRLIFCLFNVKFLRGACSLIRGIDNLAAY